MRNPIKRRREPHGVTFSGEAEAAYQELMRRPPAPRSMADKIEMVVMCAMILVGVLVFALTRADGGQKTPHRWRVFL